MNPERDSMRGKVCLVTGATRGLGQAAALGLAQRGAQVIIIGRSLQRVDYTLAFIRRHVAEACVDGLVADLASQMAVRDLAHQILARYPVVDVLINNVGATLLKYQASPDGIEMTWALNYLNHFLFNYLLMGSLKTAAAQSGEARIIEVTSSIYRLSSGDFERLQRPDRYNGVMAYAQSKRAMVMYTAEMARRLEGSGVTINTVTPGAVKTAIAGDNGLFAAVMMRLINRFALPPEIGVKPILHLAEAPHLKTTNGKYFKKFTQMPDDAANHDREKIQRLWRLSETMTRLG